MTDKPTEALKQIHEAEVRAEEIVNSARIEEKALLEKARAKAQEIVESPRDEWRRAYNKKFEEEILPLKKEIQTCFHTASDKIRKAGLKKRAGMDKIVERLVTKVLTGG